jgi:hypothetical protein
MKLRRSACSVAVGAVGYVAAMECRRVQVLRPSVSTSAGQSLGGVVTAAALSVALLCELKAEKDVHDRQLKVRR